MRRMGTCMALALGLFCCHNGWADTLKSGPQPGDFVAAFEVVKAAGNEGDGVSEGDQLCYRCKLGSRPVVAIFAHTADDSLTELIKQLDAVVVEHEDKRLASFVNLLGTDTAALKVKANDIVKKSGAKHIAVVIPAESQDGPSEYHLNPKADITVVVYKAGTVTANFALGRGQLKQGTIDKIKQSAAELVN